MIRRRLLLGAAGLLIAPRPIIAAPWQQRAPSRPIGRWDLSKLGSALIADWNADDHGTSLMTDDGAGLISMWQDRVLGMALTATGTARPTWVAAGPAPLKAALQFNGTSTNLAIDSTVGLPTGTTPVSIWVVINTIVTGLTGQILTLGGITNGTFVQIQKNGSAGDRTLASNGVVAGTVNSSPPGNHVFGGIFDATVISGQLDGTVQTPVPYTLNIGTTRLRFGANSNTPASVFFNGHLRRVLIISPVQPNSVQAQIAGYLAWDGGIQSVLTNSYKNAPP